MHCTIRQVCPALQVPAGNSPKALEVICPWSNTLDTIQTMSWDEDMDLTVKPQANSNIASALFSKSCMQR